jgi:AhpC/TSA family
VSPLSVGDVAPPILGVAFGSGPVGLFFYKVTCPTCQLAAGPTGTFERAYPGRVVGIGQDPPERLEAFAREYGMGLRAIPDLPPYPVSNAYRIESVPTLFLVGDDGTIIESVGAWDREGFNRVSRRIAELTDAESAVISSPSDGLPSLRPG